MTNSAKRKEDSHVANGGLKVSPWSKAFIRNATWEDKDEFLDVIYWIRQIIAIILGVVWGIAPLKGFLGIAIFCAINAGVLYLYFSSFQQIDEEEYGGLWELTKEGFMTSFALFLVIALVMDSLTDLDIFKDLQEACTKRRVPVYILLDQSCLPSFLQMCKSLNVRLDELQVRIPSLLCQVATGSYRFTWTDGRLNSSNLLELSGQVSEHFDEQFRILYAQSKPLNPKAPSSCWNSGVYDHLTTKLPAVHEVPLANLLGVEPCRLSSTPNRAKPAIVPPGEKAAEEPTTTCHAFTQTNVLTVDCSSTQTNSQENSAAPVPSSQASPRKTDALKCSPLKNPDSSQSPDGSLRVCFLKLSKERQYHYSTIRAKLDHMVSLLSHRRELVGLTFNPRSYNHRKMQEHNPHALRFRGGAAMPSLTVPNRLK
ncbi:FA83D protein, partial [Polyodon spathula]|nr:FA83D protein [Polyodon spathula]